MSFSKYAIDYSFHSEKCRELESKLSEEEFSESHKYWIQSKVRHIVSDCLSSRQGFWIISSTDIVPAKQWLKSETWNFIIEQLNNSGAKIIRQPLESRDSKEFIIFEIYPQWINQPNCIPK